MNRCSWLLKIHQGGRMKLLLSFAIVVGLVLFPVVIPCQADNTSVPSVSKAEWINIWGNLKKGEMPRVYPSNIYVDRGAQVLWANGTDTPMKLKLGKGTGCKTVDQTGVAEYRWALLGCIVVSVPARTIIEMFPDEGGAFNWEIEFVGTDKKLSGVLKVS